MPSGFETLRLDVNGYRFDAIARGAACAIDKALDDPIAVGRQLAGLRVHPLRREIRLGNANRPDHVRPP